ncbi:MAG: ArnT family glycosyltransferase [Thermoguttaceae bacterium]
MNQGVTQETILHFRYTTLFVVALLVVHALLLGYSATRHSPTALEGPLLMAGVSHWELGRYELYRVNPPLVRMIAAIPVMLAGCETDWTRFVDGARVRPEYGMGSQFIEINGERSIWLMTIARWACIPFSLIGGLYCFLWAREIYHNDLAGLLALILWCFDPLILANSELITNDTAATSFGIVTGYYFWHWLKSPTWMRCGVAGVTLTLAILAKTTWLFLFALWPLLAILWLYFTRKTIDLQRKTLTSMALQICAMFIVAIWCINMLYGFDGSFEKLGRYSFVSKKLATIHNTYLAEIPVPLPRQFLLGLDTQISDFEQSGQMSYLRGEWRNVGWWHYYVYGLLVKWPHGTQILFLLALTTAIFSRKHRLTVDEIIMFCPAIIVLLIVSSQTAFNFHFRYILPFVGFSFIFIGRLSLLMESCLAWKYVVSTLLCFSILSSLSVYPHSLSYFNELAGGPNNGHKHMLHSAMDWGQDLLYLKEWLKTHPEVKLDGMMYFGGFEPSSIGIDAPRPPIGCRPETKNESIDLTRAGPLPGWYAISVHSVYDSSQDYQYFQCFEPMSKAGYSIYIYHIPDNKNAEQ